MKYLRIYILILMSVFLISCKQNRAEGRKIIVSPEMQGVTTPYGPKGITRNIIQDKKGNIWIAAFTGIFRYDGKSFTNIISNVSSARFFSVLEDRKGNLWFGSIGSGVYCYDGKSFQNFTTGDGLLNNEVTAIYEDNKGNIWFGVSGGASCYNGESFQNYVIDGNTMNEDGTGKTFAKRRSYAVNCIVEDKTGKFWFATGGNTFVYDGKTFTTVTNADGKAFKNVRSVIEDKKGAVWLGGAHGLWRYNGSTFTNFTHAFVGYIIEDKKGNIWTSSENADRQGWVLLRYDAKTLTDGRPVATEVKSGEKMIFGILEANDGRIWFGSLNGVYRYNGKDITDFKTNDSLQ